MEPDGRAVKAGLLSLRDRFNVFVADHEIAWELSMAALAIAYVVTGLLPTELEDNSLVQGLDLGLTALFVAEFATRFGAARNRRAYLRGHWIDLLALVPAVRGARVLRVLRLLRLVRAFAGLYRVIGQLEAMARHRGFLLLLTSWIAVMVICSLALYAAENGINKAIGSPWDALWWGVVTLTTVGYGDVVPVTPEGRIAAVALMLLGITFFAGITATVTSFLLSSESEGEGPLHQIEHLDRLRTAGVISNEEFETKKVELLARL